MISQKICQSPQKPRNMVFRVVLGKYRKFLVKPEKTTGQRASDSVTASTAVEPCIYLYYMNPSSKKYQKKKKKKKKKKNTRAYHPCLLNLPKSSNPKIEDVKEAKTCYLHPSPHNRSSQANASNVCRFHLSSTSKGLGSSRAPDCVKEDACMAPEGYPSSAGRTV